MNQSTNGGRHEGAPRFSDIEGSRGRLVAFDPRLGAGEQKIDSAQEFIPVIASVTLGGLRRRSPHRNVDLIKCQPRHTAGKLMPLAPVLDVLQSLGKPTTDESLRFGAAGLELGDELQRLVERTGCDAVRSNVLKQR